MASTEDTITCYISGEKELARTIFANAYIFFLYLGGEDDHWPLVIVGMSKLF